MDPTLALIIESAIKSVVILGVLLTGFAYMTFAERKIAALFQTRIGPNRAGPWGWLQPAADGVKLIFKEELIPGGADKVVFILAPIITVIPALIILAVVPWGPPEPLQCCSLTLPAPINLTLGGNYFTLQNGLGLADINVGILYILSVASIAVYGIVLAGWASDNKYAMLGGIRSSAQMVSYELALGLSLVGPIMLAQSMSMDTIIAAQRNTTWFIWVQPVAAIIFYIAALAEVNRAPFDMPEAEQELTAGYHTEYSGMKFSLFFMAEYIKMIGVSAIFATLFLGGYRGPFVDQVPLLGLVYFWGKIVLSLFFMIWLRSTHPRLRYDRLMALGWKVLLPLALANVLVTAAALIDRNLFIVVVSVLAVVVLFIILAILRRRGRRRAGAPVMRRAIENRHPTTDVAA